MANPLRYKIYSADGLLMGSARYGEDAAAFVGNLGAGAKVKNARVNRIVWAEGKEEISAADSYDQAAEIMRKRVYAIIDERIAKAIAA